MITTFAFVSVVVEALNGNGVALHANQSLDSGRRAVGIALLKAALVIQLGVLGLFALLAGVFHWRCARAGLGRNRRLRGALGTLYASTALLGARTVFRVVEYWGIADVDFWRPGGVDPASLSPLVRFEWFFYVFEASLMLANHVLLNVRHPRRYLPKSTKTYLALDGVTEVQGPGYKDGRPFLLTLVDPFDLVGLAKGRKKKEARFWEEEDGASEK